MESACAALLGLLVGLVFWLRGRWQARLAELEILLQQERAATGEKLALLDDAQDRLADAFASLAGSALRSNNQAFLDLARENLATFQEHAKGDLAARQQAVASMVKPLAESLARLDAQQRDIERQRSGATASLAEQVRGLLSAQNELKGETHRLVTALRRPEVRGRWGEMQLRRVVELAGMLEHCDFTEQAVAADGQRPDMVVHLPGGKHLVLDAKAPLAAYLDASEAANTEARSEALARYARHVRNHVQQLAAKRYWEQFQPTPEFVVLFLPGEVFFAAALEQDGELLDYAGERRVVLATPTTLLALLKTVQYGWRQEALADNARQIVQQGRQLHERLVKLAEHWNGVGRHLTQTVRSYNEATASLETRVLVTARKFEEGLLTDADRELPQTVPVDIAVRAAPATNHEDA